MRWMWLSMYDATLASACFEHPQPLLGKKGSCSKRRHARVRHTGKRRNFRLPRREIVNVESVQMPVAAGAREDLHEVDRGFEEIGQLPC